MAWRRGWLPVPRVHVRSRQADGTILRCDLADRTQRAMWLGGFEREESMLVTRLLGDGMTFVDVGAHIGWFTMLAGAAVGPAGRVFAFEAFPPNVVGLRTNVELNHLKSVKVYAVAASDQPGILELGIQAGSDTGSVTAGPRAAVGIVAVGAVKLDDVLPADVLVHLMKIDVEGLELSVLRGANEVLGRTQAVLIEVNRGALRANGTDAEEVVRALDAHGLVHRRIVGRQHGSPSGEFQLPHFANLLASRRELPA